jgi:hypothetical protein
MNVQFSTCAQSVSIDQFSSRLSIFNVLEHVIVPTFPVIFPELTFVALVRGDDGELQSASSPRCTLRVFHSKRLLAMSAATIRFAGFPVVRLVFNFSGLGVTGPGDLDFQLNLPDGQGHSLKIPVSQIPVPGAAQKLSSLPKPAVARRSASKVRDRRVTT